MRIWVLFCWFLLRTDAEAFIYNYQRIFRRWMNSSQYTDYWYTYLWVFRLRTMCVYVYMHECFKWITMYVLVSINWSLVYFWVESRKHIQPKNVNISKRLVQYKLTDKSTYCAIQTNNVRKFAANDWAFEKKYYSNVPWWRNSWWYCLFVSGLLRRYIPGIESRLVYTFWKWIFCEKEWCNQL